MRDDNQNECFDITLSIYAIQKAMHVTRSSVAQ